MYQQCVGGRVQVNDIDELVKILNGFEMPRTSKSVTKSTVKGNKPSSKKPSVVKSAVVKEPSLVSTQTNKKEVEAKVVSTVTPVVKSKTTNITAAEVANTQVWVMAAVLYAILAFYEFFSRADWVAGVLNILLCAIFVSFSWKK